MSKSRFIGGFLAAFLVFATCGIAHAEQDEDSPFSWFGLAEGRSGFSSGMDITSTSQSNFGTLEVAPFGPPDKDGWRLRVYGAQATYSYRSDHTFSQMAKNEMNYAALRYEASLEAGYQFSTGNATIKTWLGPDVEYMCITPADLKKSPNGTQWGAKGGLDAWMPLGESVWLAADGSYSTAAERYSASVRLGYQPLEGLTAGPQLAAFGDRDDDAQRAGGFVSVNAFGMETTLSGGWSGNYHDTPSPYGTASVYTKF